MFARRKLSLPMLLSHPEFFKSSVKSRMNIAVRKKARHYCAFFVFRNPECIGKRVYSASRETLSFFSTGCHTDGQPPPCVEQNKKKKTKVRISFDGSRCATKAAKECEVHRRPPAVPVTQSFNARNISPC